MSTALLLAMDSSDSSDDGSYVANEESESDDEIEEPAAPERARSAAELIAALDGDAPDEEIRAMMREARPLRLDADHLPHDLLTAFKRRASKLHVIRGPTVDGWVLCDAIVTARALELSVFDIFALDEQIVLLSVRPFAVTLHAYDRHAVEAAMERHGRLTLGTADRVELNPDITTDRVSGAIAEETLFTSTQDDGGNEMEGSALVKKKKPSMRMAAIPMMEEGDEDEEDDET